MAVKTEKAAPKQESKVQRFIELAGHSRYIWEGALYEKGVAYPVNDEQLQKYLTHESGPGFRPFRLYVEPVKPVQVVHGISAPVAPLPTKDSTEVKPSNVVKGPEGARIEVGSDAELREAGIEVGGEGPLAEV